VRPPYPHPIIARKGGRSFWFPPRRTAVPGSSLVVDPFWLLALFILQFFAIRRARSPTIRERCCPGDGRIVEVARATILREARGPQAERVP